MEEQNTTLSDAQTNELEANQYLKSNELAYISQLFCATQNEIKKVIIGQDETIRLLIVALLTGGHVLLEGVPGIAKTLTVKLLAKTLNTEYKRIQFTPDLMPSDVIGTTIYNMQASDFFFRKGPVFSNVILIDEINRAPAKTQAALFEVMEERQITVDSKTYEFEKPLFIIATQNPIEQEGTYKLPEAQLDRFIFRLKMNYPSLDEEQSILMRFKDDFDGKISNTILPVIQPADLKNCWELIEKVHISDELVKYIAQIISQTRKNADIYLGASPRASLAILKSAKALAILNGRDFVTPDDIKSVLNPVLNHRIILMPEKEMEGAETEDVIKEIVNQIEVPR